MDISALLNQSDCPKQTEDNHQDGSGTEERNDSPFFFPPQATWTSRAGSEESPLWSSIGANTRRLPFRNQVPASTRPTYGPEESRDPEAMEGVSPVDQARRPGKKIGSVDFSFEFGLDVSQPQWQLPLPGTQLTGLSHRSSISQSSLSSFSFSDSVAHSRASSITTIGDFHCSSTTATEFPPLEYKLPPVLEESSDGSSTSRRTSPGRPSPVMSTQSQAERSPPYRPIHNRGHSTSVLEDTTYGTMGSTLSSRQTSLPRLSRLGHRTRAVSEPSLTQQLRSLEHQTPMDRSPLDMTFHNQPSAQGKTSPEGNVAVQQPQPQPTSPGDQCSLDDPTSLQIRLPDDDSEFQCVFLEGCDLDAPPRKSVSHFFGRNKTCTRQIPPAAWICYCRKHYQRNKYRHSGNYPAHQLQLVGVQIDRIQSWSDKNAANGGRQCLKGWSFISRKRAEGTPLPDWLAGKVKDGLSTAEVKDVAARMRRELASKELEFCPEVEFLPIWEQGEHVATPARRAKKVQRRRLSALAGTAPPSPPLKRKALQSMAPELKRLKTDGTQERAVLEKETRLLDHIPLVPSANSFYSSQGFGGASQSGGSQPTYSLAKSYDGLNISGGSRLDTPAAAATAHPRSGIRAPISTGQASFGQEFTPYGEFSLGTTYRPALSQQQFDFTQAANVDGYPNNLSNLNRQTQMFPNRASHGYPHQPRGPPALIQANNTIPQPSRVGGVLRLTSGSYPILLNPPDRAGVNQSHGSLPTPSDVFSSQRPEDDLS